MDIVEKTLLGLKQSQILKDITAELKNPFDKKFIKYRVGATSKDKKKGIALFYIDAREVQKRLDDVMTIAGWEANLEYCEKGAICKIGLPLFQNPDGSIKWVEKADAGEFTKVYPLKGAASDAFKRAAVKWGVGRFLYYIPNQWYRLNEYKMFEEEPELPKWASPNKEIGNWELKAIEAYDPTLDAGLDEVDFVDGEAEHHLMEAKAMREKMAANKEALIQALKAKQND